MKMLLLIILTLALFLPACGEASEESASSQESAELVSSEESSEMTAEESSEITVEESFAAAEESKVPSEPNPYVSTLAKEDFLTPIEDYSWSRQYPVEYVMVHFISNVVNNKKDPYNLEDVRQIFVDYNISIHYIIDREGVIRCYMPENRAAWHAGSGSYGDPKYTNAMNKYSIGIEIMAMGSADDMSIYFSEAVYNSLDESLLGYTDAQYESLKALLEDICERHSVPYDKEHIIGHEEYSPAKNDPGELFDWDRILN